MKNSYDRKFKSRVAPEALRGNLTIVEIAGKYQIHPNQVQQWKKKPLENAPGVFQTKAGKPYTEDDLMKKIGRLEVENDFFAKCVLCTWRESREAQIMGEDMPLNFFDILGLVMAEGDDTECCGDYKWLIFERILSVQPK